MRVIEKCTLGHALRRSLCPARAAVKSQPALAGETLVAPECLCLRLLPFKTAVSKAYDALVSPRLGLPCSCRHRFTHSGLLLCLRRFTRRQT